MKKRAIFLLAAILFIPLGSSSRAYILRREVTRNIDPEGRSKLAVINKFGSFRIESSSGSKMGITVRLKIRAPSKFNALKIFRDTVLDISRGKDSVLAQVKTPPLRDTGIFSLAGTVRTTVKVDYEIALPSGTGVIVDNLDGDIYLKGIDSSFDIENGKGVVTISDSRPVSGKVELSRGSIEYDFKSDGWKGELSLECGSGDIVFRPRGGIDAVLSAESRKGRIETDLAEDHRVMERDGRRTEIMIGEGLGKVSLINVKGVIKINSSR